MDIISYIALAWFYLFMIGFSYKLIDITIKFDNKEEEGTLKPIMSIFWVVVTPVLIGRWTISKILKLHLIEHETST